MGNHGCVNGSLDGVNYSSPVPIIGLYVAGASFACMAVMLYDIIVAGYLAKKRWLPCKYFKLDSVSLTLLAVATKLPVDLTTSMPGRLDQLSKLTATAIICVAMGFVAPSLGVNGESECFTNMIALSIFVVTVAANIITQLCTGVIVLFFVEHIIMLCLMFLLLLMLWHICFYIRTEKRIDSDRYSNLLSKGSSSSMFERLKICSLYAYCSNPQFKISMHPMNAAISTICVGCLGIIIETATRSLILKQLKFCDGDSDYSWSMPVIVYVQIATVVVGTIAIFVRWVSLFSRMDLDIILVSFLRDDEHVIQMKQTLRAKGISWHRFWNLLVFVIGWTITKIVLIAQFIIVFPSQMIRDCIFRIKKPDNNLEYFEEVAATGYIVRKSLDDMMRSMKKVAKSNSENHPSRFLVLKHHSPQLQLHSLKIIDGSHEIEVCSLSVALLVKLAQASIPKDLLGSILNAFHEAKEVLHFIDKIIQPKSSENNDKLAYAESLWRDGDFTYLLPGRIQPVSDHTVAKKTLNDLKRILHSGKVWSDLGFIINYINRTNYSSIEELYACIEQLFVDMMHMLYAQLPNAIYKSLRACPAEEFEESAKTATEFLFKIQELDCQGNWSFPEGMWSIINDNKHTTGELKRLGGVVLVSRGQKFEIKKAPTLSTSVASTSSSVASTSVLAVVISSP